VKKTLESQLSSGWVDRMTRFTGFQIKQLTRLLTMDQGKKLSKIAQEKSCKSRHPVHPARYPIDPQVVGRCAPGTVLICSRPDLPSAPASSPQSLIPSLSLPVI
jgi:hypothetical protein